jgi:phosphoribosylaminoimidazole-succinocarboxamide synthase
VPVALRDVQLSIPRVASGKVRELFDAGQHLLMVATDRISVFDVVLPTPIPDKGAVLNGLSVFWFDRTRAIVPNHMVEWRASGFPASVAGADTVASRSMVVRRAEMVPIECTVRGYLAGTGWADYRRSGSVCGIALPSGMREADRLPEPIFTPATKATTGHDENISLQDAARTVGDPALVVRMRDISIALYRAGAEHAAARGIILADTKFEFGLVDGEIVLCDEALTPDSSRYWPAESWEPGRTPPSFDKQFVRDYANTLGWDHSYPGPELPPEVVEGTRSRYVEAYERITGHAFAEYLSESA